MLQDACIFVCAHEYAYNDIHTLSLSVTALLSLPSKQIQVKLTSSNSIFSFFILFSAMGIWGGFFFGWGLVGGAVCWHARNPVIVSVYVLL